jgi:DNA-binding NarL/FixJ family response regulator
MMAGGTLMISRAIKNFAYCKQCLEGLGFRDVTVTALERDALYFLIEELEPEQIMIGARFYHCCTPFMMGELHRKFPQIKKAAISLSEFPADIAMYFILNGINSYLTLFEGIEQFNQGLNEIAKGREYVSPEVMERIRKRQEKPDPAGVITERHKQVLHLICCGFRDKEIADVLAVSRNTIVNHKTDIFTTMNVRSPIELLRAVLTLEILRLEELYFYPKDYTVNPLPLEKIKGRGKQ